MKTVQPIENERKENQPMNDWIPLVLHENQVCFLIELDGFSLFFLASPKKSFQLVFFFWTRNENSPTNSLFFFFFWTRKGGVNKMVHQHLLLLIIVHLASLLPLVLFFHWPILPGIFLFVGVCFRCGCVVYAHYSCFIFFPSNSGELFSLHPLFFLSIKGNPMFFWIPYIPEGRLCQFFILRWRKLLIFVTSFNTFRHPSHKLI
jgi:hypothetical protein